MVHRRALEADRGRLLSEGLAAWLTRTLGVAPRALDTYQRALTHPSRPEPNYQRLEFLGDRVLGLAVAEWLIERFPEEREGALSHRFTTLVSGATCAGVARAIGVQKWLRLGKQGQDDGVFESDYVLGDAIEALIGAVYLDHGFAEARALVRRLWAGIVEGQGEAPRHPKSLLHEWAEAHKRKPPVYTVTGRAGPDHALRFTVCVSLGSAGEATGEGSSKQEAETAAAAALLVKLA